MDYKDVFAAIVKEAVNTNLVDWYVDTYFSGNWHTFEDEFRKSLAKVYLIDF